MILDAQTLLWDAAALSTDAASTNTYDTGAAGNDISVGEPLCAVVSVDVAAAVAGTETYELQVIQSASANLGTPDILVSCFFTTARATTLLAAGKLFVVPIPPGSITKRSIGMYFNGENSAGITVTAWIAPLSMVPREKVYADAITIS